MPPKKREREEPAPKKADTPDKKLRTEGASNDALIKVFEELMVYESKAGNTWGGSAYQKVAAALKKLKKPVTAGTDVANLAGFGKASVEKIDEFLKTGKIQKLEELKELYGDIPTGMVMKSGGKAAATAAASKPTKDQLKKIAKEAELLELNSIDQLKQLLRQNGQVLSGTKGELIERCAEGKILGAIPVCPLCGAGKLRYAAKTGLYTCPGYMDDDKFHKCVFVSGSVARNPWK